MDTTQQNHRSSSSPNNVIPLSSAHASARPQGPTIVANQAASSVQAPLAFVKVHHVQGKFSYSQDLSATERPSQSAPAAARAASASPELRTLSNPLEWRLSVGGLVSAPFEKPLAELAQASARTASMGYRCADEPVDAPISARAKVTGVPVAAILMQAGVSERANAITFVSTDDFEIRLPLSFVREHGATIVYQLNGKPLSQTVGCTNQLWLEGVSAHYFVRDVEAIRLSEESAATMPPVPGTPASGDQFRNRPNVGVLGGFSIA